MFRLPTPRRLAASLGTGPSERSAAIGQAAAAHDVPLPRARPQVVKRDARGARR